MRPASIVVLAGLLCLVARPAGAWSVGSAFSDFCHERMAMKAFFGDSPLPDKSYEVSVPQDQAWVKIAHYLETKLNLDLRDDLDRMALISLFIGERWPDQAGFAIFDIKSLRQVHLSEREQYEHSLRSPKDDHEKGEQWAIVKTRLFILKLVQDSYEAYHSKDKDVRVQEVDFYLEHYGQIKVKVWMPLFLLGRAAHTLQDSFSHTYRSDDCSTIYAVGNYIDGISADYDEARDGPKHSDYLDMCQEPEVKPLADAATRATRELMGAVAIYWKTKDSKMLEAVLKKWTQYKSGCGYANNYCGSKWATLAKRGESSAPLSCAAVGASSAAWWCIAVVLLAWIRLRWPLRCREF